MSYDEYASTQRPELYTFTVTYKSQHLFYFGANHSVDPKNQQFSLIKEFWDEFVEKTDGRNCVVLKDVKHLATLLRMLMNRIFNPGTAHFDRY